MVKSDIGDSNQRQSDYYHSVGGRSFKDEPGGVPDDERGGPPFPDSGSDHMNLVKRMGLRPTGITAPHGYDFDVCPECLGDMPPNPAFADQEPCGTCGGPL